MGNALTHTLRLMRAGAVLAWNGAPVAPEGARLPLAARVFKGLASAMGGRRSGRAERLARALTTLGPSYIKLGQFLATRPDVIGLELAAGLGGLRDKLPPFPMREAQAAIKAELGAPVEALFAEFGPPIAAASIAQVHKGAVREPDGSLRAVAVKILRPGIEARFANDLESFFFAARQIERWHPPSRRLRPVAAVETLAASTAIEMDLRMEAAAISEMAENIARHADPGFRVPKVDWTRTAKRVLTLEWIDGIPVSDLAAIDAAGLDRQALGLNIIRSFLRHAMRDGFFHADLHQGNLFADRDGTLVAVDFGIMGRLGANERRFLAEILFGFITRQYRRIAEVHFEAGYVPPDQSVETFAQALRAIGEPIKDRPAAEISMARVLTQLFEVTELFGMRTRPELLLLQKTMVVTEGVARTLDPNINIWVAAEPVVRAWMADQLGPRARLRDAAGGMAAIAGIAAQAPQLAAQAARTARALAEMVERREQPGAGEGEGRCASGGWHAAALWLGALSLAAIAVRLWLGA